MCHTTHAHILCLNPALPLLSAPTPNSEQPTSFQPRVLSATFNAFLKKIASPRRNIRNNWFWQSWLIRNALIRTFFLLFSFWKSTRAHSSRRFGDQPVTVSAQTFRAEVTGQLPRCHCCIHRWAPGPSWIETEGQE